MKKKVNKKRVWAIVLKLPLQLSVIAVWITSFYAAMKVEQIGWETPITLTVLLALYVIGILVARKKK